MNLIADVNLERVFLLLCSRGRSLFACRYHCVLFRVGFREGKRHRSGKEHSHILQLLDTVDAEEGRKGRGLPSLVVSKEPAQWLGTEGFIFFLSMSPDG